MFNNTITIFNYYEDKDEECYYWFSKVLSGVGFQKSKGLTARITGNQDANNAVLHIPVQLSGGEIYSDGVQYQKPKEWAKGQAKEDSFTLKAGDFFMEGVFEDKVVDETNYPNGFFEYMKSQYDDVFRITDVDGPYKGIPHFEVGGK